MSSYWRIAGLSYLRYSSIAAKVVRSVTKDVEMRGANRDRADRELVTIKKIKDPLKAGGSVAEELTKA